MKQEDQRDSTQNNGKIRILHVTESMGSGVEAVIGDYARNSPNYEHHLLFSTRGFRTGDSIPAFATSLQVDGGKFALARKLRTRIQSIQPDILHLHSSWAGIFGRVWAGPRRRYAIVYSPHSFYFSRTDLLGPLKKLAHAVEKMLSLRTDYLAAVSPFEATQATQLSMKSVVVPHVIPFDLLSIKPSLERQKPVRPVIATVGRICRQKDPRFLIEVKKDIDAYGVAADWVWIGDGAEDLRVELGSAGVKVTGWLDRDNVLQQLSLTDLYVHTAAWEGAPVSVLEVQALGIPLVVRSIPSLESLGFPSGLEKPLDLGLAIRQLLSSTTARLAAPIPIAGDQEQKKALTKLYEGALHSEAARRKRRTKEGMP